LGIKAPSEDKLNAALNDIAGYKPSVKKDLQGRKTVEPRYYGLSLELDLAEMVQHIIAAAKDAKPEDSASAQEFLDGLIADARVVARPHITIVHEKSVAAEKEASPSSQEDGPQARLWNTCASFRGLPSPPRFDFSMVSLLWDERVMTLVVDDVRPHDKVSSTAAAGETTKNAADIETALCNELKHVLHVTVGTREESIAPFEARALVERWRQEKAGGSESSVKHLDIEGVVECGRVLGMS
jgi:tRNA ligase